VSRAIEERFWRGGNTTMIQSISYYKALPFFVTVMNFTYYVKTLSAIMLR